MTAGEVKALLDVCPAPRRLVYEVALTSGLRLNELVNLRVSNFDATRGGIHLDAAWTKNRKAGFQPLPGWLVEKLSDAVKGKAQSDCLLKVRKDAAHGMDLDLKRAGIPKWAAGWKIDFHALRVAYVSFVLESGASVKEAQSMARHSTPDLTVNVYARARNERLKDVAETVGGLVGSRQVHAHSMHAVAAGAESDCISLYSEMDCKNEVAVVGGGATPSGRISFGSKTLDKHPTNNPQSSYQNGLQVPFVSSTASQVVKAFPEPFVHGIHAHSMHGNAPFDPFSIVAAAWCDLPEAVISLHFTLHSRFLSAVGQRT